MHLSEGVLSVPVLAGGAVLAMAAVAKGLRTLPDERIPLAGLLCAMFFVTSLIHVPVGVASVHLVMNGLCGVMLGWAAFPVMLVALTLQALLFGFGGLTTLGVNTLVMGVSALICGQLFSSVSVACDLRVAGWQGALAGALGVLLGVMLMTAALWLSGGSDYLPLMGAVLLAHAPVMLIEAAVTGVVVSSLCRVRPAWLRPTGES